MQFCGTGKVPFAHAFAVQGFPGQACTQENSWNFESIFSLKGKFSVFVSKTRQHEKDRMTGWQREGVAGLKNELHSVLGVCLKTIGQYTEVVLLGHYVERVIWTLTKRGTNKVKSERARESG